MRTNPISIISFHPAKFLHIMVIVIIARVVIIIMVGVFILDSGDAAFLISVGGISNTLGRWERMKMKSETTRANNDCKSHFRLLGGWLSDKHWAPKVS